jgi:hypothetical protein
MVVTPIVLPRKCETCMMNRLTRFLKLAGFDAGTTTTKANQCDGSGLLVLS